MGSATHTLNASGEPQGNVEGYAIERSYLPIFNVLTEERALMVPIHFDVTKRAPTYLSLC